MVYDYRFNINMFKRYYGNPCTLYTPILSNTICNLFKKKFAIVFFLYIATPDVSIATL